MIISLKISNWHIFQTLCCLRDVYQPAQGSPSPGTPVSHTTLPGCQSQSKVERHPATIPHVLFSPLSIRERIPSRQIPWPEQGRSGIFDCSLPCSTAHLTQEPVAPQQTMRRFLEGSEGPGSTAGMRGASGGCCFPSLPPPRRGVVLHQQPHGCS